jgi:hypothetical protein
MVSDVYVLGARVLNWILGNIDDTCIVIMNSHGTLRKAVVRQKLLHPEQLNAASTSSYVLHFSNGEENSRLFPT